MGRSPLEGDDEEALLRTCRSLLDAAGDGLYRLDAAGRVVAVDDDLAALTGHAPEDLVGRPAAALLTDEAVSTAESTVRAMLENGLETATLELDLERADGRTVPCRVRMSPLLVDGEFRGTVGLVSDRSGDRDGDRRGDDPATRELEAVYERVDDAFYALDDRFRFTYVNDRAEELLEASEADLLGERIWDRYPEATETEAWDALHEAMETNEPTSFETYYEPLGLWVEANVYPSETGLSVYFRDVTDRKQLQAELEEQNETLQRLYEISAASERPFEERVQQVLDLGHDYLGVDVGFLASVDVETDSFEIVHSTGDDDRFDPGSEAPLGETYCRRTLESEGLLGVEDAPAEGWTGDPAYERWELDCYLGGKVFVGEELFGTLCFVERAPRSSPFTGAERRFVELATQWVSYELERHRRESQLREYKEYTDDVLDAVDDVFYVIDGAGDIRRWNESLREVTGYTDEEIGSMHALEFFDEAHHGAFGDAIEEVLETGSARVEAPFLTKAGEEVPHEFVASRVEAPDGSPRVTGIGRDISERLARERELRRRGRQQAVVANLGQLGLETDDLEELMGAATRLLAETLDTDFAGLLELDADADELVLRQVAGADPDLDLVGRRVGTDADSQSGYTLGTEEPVVVEDLEAETRFDPPRLLTDADVLSGVSTVVGSVEDPWGVLTAHDTERREFTEDDVNFVQSVANVLATAIDRVRRERELQRHRERLEALNSLHEVIHGITEAVIERSTREEIEQAVCEHLADSESYRFAWIGDVDSRSGQVTPRASAGTGGYLEEITVSIDPEDSRSEGPIGRALLTGEVQTCQRVRTDPQFEPWREQAETYGFRSAAAIPIVHEDTVYGVLAVYAERPDAFADEEREIVEQVGEVVGHAIAAVERKRALMSDEVLEVEFRVPGVFDAYDVPDVEGRIEFDRVVPVGDDYLMYGRVTPAAVPALEALGEELPHWESVTVRGEADADADDPARFEVRESESRLVGGIADYGGVVEEAVVEDGHLDATVHLPGGTDVRDVLDAVAEQYPTVDLLARRQVEREGDTVRETTLALTEELTDRQQTALETAYHAGFFEWPRDSSGEEIADQLGIAPATFTQHLRTAERKLFDALFEELPTGE